MQAPRLPFRSMRSDMRGAWLALCLVPMALGALASSPGSVTVQQGDTTARFLDPTDRYGHAVLGNTPEWGTFCLSRGAQERCVTLPASEVIEDIAPRLFDVDLDGKLEAVLVQSTTRAGAALVVYDLEDGALRKTATPNIGTRNRWLAPLGAADLDGDGYIEIAYIDRPHLAKTLRVWRYKDQKLTEIATLAGLTNHKIGEDWISGGIRDCGNGPEIITADSRWRRVIATGMVGGELASEDIGPFKGQRSFAGALSCE